LLTRSRCSSIDLLNHRLQGLFAESGEEKEEGREGGGEDQRREGGGGRAEERTIGEERRGRARDERRVSRERQ
jgi:hypothetical protein